MTSVQSAPALPQGGVSLPPNLTQQHVQEVYQVSHNFEVPLHLIIKSSHNAVTDVYLEVQADERTRCPPR